MVLPVWSSYDEEYYYYNKVLSDKVKEKLSLNTLFMVLKVRRAPPI